MLENVKYDGSGKFISRGEWIHPERIIKSYEIIFVTEGEVNIEENEIKYILKKDDILILEPDKNHKGFKKSSNTSFYWMHFISENNPLSYIKTLHIDNSYNLTLLSNQLIHYSLVNNFPEVKDYLIRIIIAEIYSISENLTDNKLVNQIAEWIRINSDTKLTAKDISEYFGYNSDYISRLFKKYYNMSLKKYVDEAKINTIKKKLLSSSLSLPKISDECGFEEYKYFLKFFKYHTNMTPTKFRSTYSKTHIINK